MSLPSTTGFVFGPGEGEALWFNGGLGLLKATGDLTEGRFAAMELLHPKGSPHRFISTRTKTSSSWSSPARSASGMVMM
jgi:hypothetical protein